VIVDHNGTARQFGYPRSGFVGWAIPIAYKVLTEIGHTPAWDAGRLETFKRALDSWLSPMNEASNSGGLLELGNWNKGFQHLADAAAVMAIFPEVDAWEHNKGLYAAYVPTPGNSRLDDMSRKSTPGNLDVISDPSICPCCLVYF